MVTTFKRVRDANGFTQYAFDRITEYYSPYSLEERITVKKILAVTSEQDAVAAMDSSRDFKKYLFMAEIADLSLHVFEDVLPYDNRARSCINSVRGFATGISSWVKVMKFRNELRDITGLGIHAQNAINAAKCENTLECCLHSLVALRAEWGIFRPIILKYCI